jgi:hypothetical protein
MIESVAPGGRILDLQVIRPNPVVEVGDRVVCEIDGAALFAYAEPAAAAVDAAVADRSLREEAVDDHDVRSHFDNGAELVSDMTDKGRPPPADAVPMLRAIERQCAVRERCRLRLLSV